ncbi:hypothetical protein GQ55_9G401900 [Panicum hallii var. hallii]|uniref:Uncharacterized protein n=1 Tax=Panicum hallii var. hallii TaxID=1504633 RepID=A0A2T7C9Y9_9POAL|nr:hypothetical protein GQ55_9G401900 [Panicum hallii var. hallii]
MSAVWSWNRMLCYDRGAEHLRACGCWCRLRSQTQRTAQPLQGPQLRRQMRGMANSVQVHDLPA